LVEAARDIARAGDRDEARRVLETAVEGYPACVEAWLGLAWLAGTPEERETHLQRVLALEPSHAKATAELARITDAPAEQKAPSSSKRRWAWVLLAIPLGLLVAALLIWGPVDQSMAWLLPTQTPTVTPTSTMTPSETAAQFEPQLETALQSESWERAFELLAIMNSVDPGSETVQRLSQEAHMIYGRVLVNDDHPDQALAEFDRALALAPEDEEAQLWHQTTQLYLEGRQALDDSDWDVAVAALTQAHDLIPDYKDLFAQMLEAYRSQGQAALAAEDWTTAIEAMTVAHKRIPDNGDLVELLSLAYRGRGISHQEASELERARADLEAALALRPDDKKALKHLDEVMFILFPPKKIVIDISEQRMYVYEGDNLIWKWVCSTGIPGRDTATGNYKVLDKIPEAYSRIWRLRMPNWLGIYYVGGIENGIHSLPIRPDGTVMWGGFLGRKASYGCIILDKKNSKKLYNWAEIGTEVVIRN
jgi:Flp pilus assembly protein TadD